MWSQLSYDFTHSPKLKLTHYNSTLYRPKEQQQQQDQQQQVAEGDSYVIITIQINTQASKGYSCYLTSWMLIRDSPLLLSVTSFQICHLSLKRAHFTPTDKSSLSLLIAYPFDICAGTSKVAAFQGKSRRINLWPRELVNNDLVNTAPAPRLPLPSPNKQ